MLMPGLQEPKERGVSPALCLFSVNAPEFLTGSDAILNLGRRLAKKMAALHKLHSFELPLKVPGFEIAMLWNRRNTPSQARSWLRKLIERCAGDDDTRQR